MRKLISTFLIAFFAVFTAKADFTYGNNGLFTITGTDDLSISITRDFGGNKAFGYFKYDPVTGERGELISLNITEGQTAIIDGLSAGDVIGFYTEHAGQGTIYSNDTGKKDSLNLDSLGLDTETGISSYNIKVGDNKNGVHFGILSIPTSAPTGQPLPGVFACIIAAAIGLPLYAKFRKSRKES